MKRLKSLGIGLVAVLVVVGGLASVKAAQIGAMIDAGESFVPPPIAVTTAEVEAASWDRSLTAVGTLVPVQEIVVASEVPGTIVRLPVDSGEDVERGDLIAQLDTSSERADLRSALAGAELAELDRDRNRRLLDQQAVSQAVVDQSEAQAKQAAAAVASLRAIIGKKTIRAPFPGRLGIREVDLGEVISPGTPIVPLQALDPVFVEFRMPEQSAALVAVEQPVRLTVDVFPEEVFEGTVTVIDPIVDQSTRSLRVRATLANPEGRLRPGMFADVSVELPGEREVLILPSTAVLYAPYGDSVFVVEEDEDDTLRARQVFVRLGERRGDFVEVRGGVDLGATVVTTGAFKLKNGLAVTLQNELEPETTIEPSPPNE